MAFREFSKNKNECVRVSPSRYQGYDLVDVRVYARNRVTGDLIPTKKGISLNVDAVPDLVEALTWALGQPCSDDPDSPEHELIPADADRLAQEAWAVLSKHGTAVHWDTAERLVLDAKSGFTKWDLHFVLATRSDLFQRTDPGCFRARKNLTKAPQK